MGLPLLLDPLISAYDKQINERRKLLPASVAARKLLHWEQHLFQGADLLLADTEAHSRYFQDTHRVPKDRIQVIPVGAEERLFRASLKPAPSHPIEVLFYGSFIPLQGTDVIAEAARWYRGPDACWRLIGHGSCFEACRKTRWPAHVVFQSAVPYEELPARIQEADIVLGIFGTTAKAQRVIPNKVYQALACARPVVTAHTRAYPSELRAASASGIAWVPPGDAKAIARAVASLAQNPGLLSEYGQRARYTYDRYFSQAKVCAALTRALSGIRRS